MKRILPCLVVSLIALLLLPSSGFSARGIRIEKENRIALVVGNGDYRSAPLRNPVNDARDMADILRGMAFNVIHLENTSQRKMEDAIRDFGKNLRSGGIGVFYYAGHGMQVQGRNYLIPIGADIYKEADIKYEAVDVGRLLDEMYEAGNGLNIVILDACRDNPFARSFRSGSKGLARMDAPKGTLITYATAPGSVAADGEGRNGIYTKHLIRHMATPGLSVENVLKRVRVDVVKETGGRQIPWEASSLMGDFSFMPEEAEKAGQAAPPRPQLQTQPSTGGGQTASYEILFWESIKDTNDVQMYEEYLRKFPTGMFAGLATIKIQNLSKTKTAAKPAAAPQSPPKPADTPQSQPTLASIPKSQPPPAATGLAPLAPASQRAGARKKLAIFPWKPANEYWNWAVIKAVENTIEETRLFDAAFSFYEMDSQFEARRIREEDLLSFSGVDYLDSLWAYGSSGKLEPNTDVVARIATYLRVDAVLMCNVKIHRMDPPDGKVTMYLVDVGSGRTVSVSGRTTGFDENGFSLSKRLATELFDTRNLAKATAQAAPAASSPNRPAPTVATLAPQPASSARAGSRKTLAIFPWEPANEYWNWAVIKAIEKTIEETRLFSVAFSFYDLDRDTEVRKITEEDLLSFPEVDYLNSLWGGWGAPGLLEPRVELIAKIANYLRVDAVLMCNVKIHRMDPPDGKVAMYLIHARDGKMIQVRGATSGFDENGYRLAKRLGDALFEKVGPSR